MRLLGSLGGGVLARMRRNESKMVAHTPPHPPGQLKRHIITHSSQWRRRPPIIEMHIPQRLVHRGGRREIVQKCSDAILFLHQQGPVVQVSGIPWPRADCSHGVCG